jgi:RNA polymerase sigma-70 factor (ECF subfamily)
LEQGERTADIDAALARLREVEREVVVLRYFCGLNSREIGEVLEMAEATVRSHLTKARRQLARDLADWNDAVE